MNGDRNVSGASTVKNYITLQFIWAALVISVIIYLGVAYFLLSSGQFEGPQVPINIMFPVLAATSLIILVPQILLQSFLSDDRLFPRILETVRSGRHTAVIQDPGSTVLLQNHMTYGIITWALGEMPSVFGLMLTFLSGDMRYVAGFALYSILNMLVFRPRRSRYEDQLARLRRYMATRV